MIGMPVLNGVGQYNLGLEGADYLYHRQQLIAVNPEKAIG
jgi:hypothetical protein